MSNTMNDPSLRYDSSDADAANQDLHTIQTYLSDALALEKHIAQPLARQLALDDSAKFNEAVGLITTIKSMTDTHIAHLEKHLELAGGHPASGLKSAWAQLIGVGAAAVDGSRKMKVSKNLRDDYTALALATISYTMLHATALGLGDEDTATLAQTHLSDYAKVIVNIGKAMPGVVLAELALQGENVRISVAEIAERNTDAAWK
jgi:ferritin-like metal-binding protein YciE